MTFAHGEGQYDDLSCLTEAVVPVDIDADLVLNDDDILVKPGG